MRRVPAIAVLACVLTPVGAQAPRDAAPPRQTRVLEVLHRIPVLHSQLHATAIATATNEYGCAIVAPSVRGLCGTGWQPAFDPDLARSLARELCAIYGLQPAVGAPAPAGQPARLDAFDAGRGIGLKLRGVVEPKPLPTGGAWPTVVDEPAATDLDVAEHRALAAANVRVHVADVHAFWTAGAADRMTTTLCYLASVVAFLNEVTDGEDVDLTALVPHSSRWLPLELPKARAGLTVTAWGGGCTLLTTRAVEVALPVAPARATEPGTGTTVGTIANDGRPVTLQLLLGAERGAFTVTVRQRGKDGREHDLASSTHGLVFAPDAFDATRPFAFVLALEPGQYRLNDAAWLSGPAAAAR